MVMGDITLCEEALNQPAPLTSPMPEARKTSRLGKASTLLTHTLNTLVFIAVARELGADGLGGVALLLSLGACVTLSFDLSNAWPEAGGRSARAVTHLSFAGAGIALALYGAAASPQGICLPLGLFAAYHGASSAAAAIAGGNGGSAAAALADAASRLVLLACVIRATDAMELASVTVVAAIFAAGGMTALAVSVALPSRVHFSEVRAEFGSASLPALSFALLMGTLVWADKPLLYILGDQPSLGAYFAVQRTAVFIGAGAVVITGMVSGRFKALPGADGARLVTLMERYASLCVVPMAAFYMAFSEPLVETFFGSDYAAHHWLVIPLVLAGTMMALASPSVAWLVEHGRWGELSSAAGMSLALLLLLPVAASELLGGIEPSMAVALGGLASASTFFALVRRAPYANGSRFHGHLPKHVPCAAMMAFILWHVSSGLADIGLAELSLLAVAGVLVYGLLVYLFGEFMQGEWTEFKVLRGV
jgi:O-antigen/teichoic acid export membrane protein